MIMKCHVLVKAQQKTRVVQNLINGQTNELNYLYTKGQKMVFTA